jgi:3-methyl-2-oxobutanoate hydroxymethyltransferase
MGRLTIKALLDRKGGSPLTQVFVRSAPEAAACEAAGIDMIVASRKTADVVAIRKAAPKTFMTVGLGYGLATSIPQALEIGYRLLGEGIDAVYCPQSLDYVKALADEGIPPVTHIGYVPYKSSWFGGPRAVGKTLEEATGLYRLARSHEAAGAIGIEVEVVPDRIAAAISRSIRPITIGMGAGRGCDVQYLFATDILGDNEGHVPRHAKAYRDHKAERARLHADAIAAFGEFKSDVRDGRFPKSGHSVDVADDVFEAFMFQINSSDPRN